MGTMQHTAHDRCDQCRAQGYTTWTNGNHSLTFCGHHTSRYENALTRQGFTLLVDDTAILFEEC